MKKNSMADILKLQLLCKQANRGSNSLSQVAALKNDSNKITLSFGSFEEKKQCFIEILKSCGLTVQADKIGAM